MSVVNCGHSFSRASAARQSYSSRQYRTSSSGTRAAPRTPTPPRAARPATAPGPAARPGRPARAGECRDGTFDGHRHHLAVRVSRCRQFPPDRVRLPGWPCRGQTRRSRRTLMARAVAKQMAPATMTSVTMRGRAVQPAVTRHRGDTGGRLEHRTAVRPRGRDRPEAERQPAAAAEPLPRPRESC